MASSCRGVQLLCSLALNNPIHASFSTTRLRTTTPQASRSAALVHSAGKAIEVLESTTHLFVPRTTRRLVYHVVSSQYSWWFLIPFFPAPFSFVPRSAHLLLIMKLGFLVVATRMIFFASNSFKGINHQRSKAVFRSKTQCAFLHAGILWYKEAEFRGKSKCRRFIILIFLTTSSCCAIIIIISRFWIQRKFFCHYQWRWGICWSWRLTASCWWRCCCLWSKQPKDLILAPLYIDSRCLSDSPVCAMDWSQYWLWRGIYRCSFFCIQQPWGKLNSFFPLAMRD